MRKVRCIVADDEPLAVALLTTYIERHPRLELAGAFTNPFDALDALRCGGVDVAFLDIEMPGMSGIDLARAATDCGARLIFVTAYRDYAIDGFRVHAFDYLLKPVSYDEFTAAADRAVAQIAPPTVLTVRADRRLRRIDFPQIIYIQGLRDYVRIVTTDGGRPVLTQIPLKDIAAELPENFRRVHRSYIVNTTHITAIDGANVYLGPHTVPLGPSYRPLQL